MSAPWLRALPFSQNTNVGGKEEPGLFRGTDMKIDVSATRESSAAQSLLKW